MTEFVKSIGGQRFFQLAGLIAANVILFGMWFFWLMPAQEEAQSNLAVIDSQLTELRMSIDTVKDDTKFLQSNQSGFETLRTSGFLAPQDRFHISKQLEDMRKNFRVIGFSYSIGDTEVVANAEAQAAQFQLVGSDIKFDTMKLYTDMDLFAFINAMGQYLPGHARVQNLELRRAMPVSASELLNIMNKQPKGFFEANLTIKLMTMVGQEQKGNKVP